MKRMKLISPFYSFPIHLLIVDLEVLVTITRLGLMLSNNTDPSKELNELGELKCIGKHAAHLSIETKKVHTLNFN